MRTRSVKSVTTVMTIGYVTILPVKSHIGAAAARMAERRFTLSVVRRNKIWPMLASTSPGQDGRGFTKKTRVRHPFERPSKADRTRYVTIHAVARVAYHPVADTLGPDRFLCIARGPPITRKANPGGKDWGMEHRTGEWYVDMQQVPSGLTWRNATLPTSIANGGLVWTALPSS